MHVLLITHFFPPKHNTGTENYTLSLAQALQSKGHAAEVLCAEDWDIGDDYWNGVTEEIYDGVLVHRIHLNWTKASNPNKVLYDSSLVEKWLDKFLGSNVFDVVHVTSTYTLGVGVLRSVKRSGLPLVLTLMDFWFICPSVQLLRSDGDLCDGRTTPWQCQSCLMGGSALYNRLEKLSSSDLVMSRIWGTAAQIPLLNKQRGLRGMLLNMDERKRLLSHALTLPDVVISHSAVVQEIFSKLTPVPVKVIRNGYDLSWLNQYQRSTCSDRIRFSYIGQINETKGVHVLVEAFQEAHLDGRARLDIWGDQKRNIRYTEKLLKFIGGDRSITLRGRYERDQLEKVLAEIDVLVVPSLWYENAPLVIQEAFAAKIPVIASNLGGMAEAIKHEVDGLLFERGDFDDLARQFRRVVYEPGLLEQLQNGILAPKKIEEETTELLSIYQNLIVERGDRFNEYA